MEILHILFFQPVYNLFNLVLYVLPGHTLWIAIFLIVVAVKFLLLPLTISQTKNNIIFQRLQEKVKAVTKKTKDIKQKNQEIMELYKAEGVSPFSPLKGLFIQVPIFLSIFFVVLFLSGDVDSSILYSDTLDFGGEIDRSFFSIIDLSGDGNIYMAGIVGVLQLTLFRILMSKNKNQSKQTKNILTFAMVSIIVIASYNIGIGASFYWCVNLSFSIFQDLFILRNKN